VSRRVTHNEAVLKRPVGRKPACGMSAMSRVLPVQRLGTTLTRLEDRFGKTMPKRLIRHVNELPTIPSATLRRRCARVIAVAWREFRHLIPYRAHARTAF